ncbi:hypothetical protein AX774_g6595 [Zancudomyces culisetae]|uniref:Uncharacterized protein n=1 Tax=Zancudomyces culisetae TaxID=1213189 RepID=A0A1R1PGC5_ZANCU|nr:hypothetical protein AX774_g6595 [Zancudomyces culisetae]|eukprot:OMH79979.1 hypothetical protein AX774_g6595 [Zancudomyces culisetae]
MEAELENGLDPRELLLFYKRQQGEEFSQFKKSEEEIERIMTHVKNIEGFHNEIKQMLWKLDEKDEEIERLKSVLEEHTQALVEERQNNFKALEAVDRLKVKVQRKSRQVKYLVAVNKELQRNFGDQALDLGQIFTSKTKNEDDGLAKGRLEDPKTQDLLIENETLVLSAETLKIQLDEQKRGYEEIVNGLKDKIKSMRSDEKSRTLALKQELEEMTLKYYNIQAMYRENIRETLLAKKESSLNRVSLDENQTIMKWKVLELRSQIDDKNQKINELEQNDALVKETKLKQAISRSEVKVERLKKEAEELRGRAEFDLNSIFAELVEIKRLIFSAFQILGLLRTGDHEYTETEILGDSLELSKSSFF